MDDVNLKNMVKFFHVLKDAGLLKDDTAYTDEELLALLRQLVEKLTVSDKEIKD